SSCSPGALRALPPFPTRRSSDLEPEGVHDLVAEVDGAARGHQLLVLLVGPGELELLRDALAQRRVLGRRPGEGCQAFRERQVLLARDVLVLAAADQRDQRLDVPGRIAEGPVALEWELEEPV